MKTRKERPEYEALVPRIASGELTRAQAAVAAQAMTGLSQQTFISWITANREVREKLKDTRRNAGIFHRKTDPDKVEAYEKALAMAMSSTKWGAAKEAAEKFDVNYVVLCRRLKKAKEALPVTGNASQADDDTVRALEDALEAQT